MSHRLGAGSLEQTRCLALPSSVIVENAERVPSYQLPPDLNAESRPTIILKRPTAYLKVPDSKSCITCRRPCRHCVPPLISSTGTNNIVSAKTVATDTSDLPGTSNFTGNVSLLVVNNDSSVALVPHVSEEKPPFPLNDELSAGSDDCTSLPILENLGSKGCGKISETLLLKKHLPSLETPICDEKTQCPSTCTIFKGRATDLSPPSQAKNETISRENDPLPILSKGVIVLSSSDKTDKSSDTEPILEKIANRSPNIDNEKNGKKYPFPVVKPSLTKEDIDPINDSITIGSDPSTSFMAVPVEKEEKLPLLLTDKTKMASVISPPSKNCSNRKNRRNISKSKYVQKNPLHAFEAPKPVEKKWFPLRDRTNKTRVCLSNLVVVEISTEDNREGEIIKNDPPSVLGPQKISIIKNSCPICFKTFRTSRALKDHDSVHTGARDYICDVCHKGYSTRANLLIHKRTHDGKKLFSCDICEKSFRKKDTLTVHLRNHTGERPFSCALCSRSFVRKSILQTHIARHNLLKRFLCQICGKFLTSLGGLRYHESTHTILPNTLKFRKPENLKPSNKSVLCQVCGKVYSNMSNFRGHELVHKGEKPFKCPICSRVYAKKDSLRIHHRSHLDQRLYSCDLCDYAAYRNGTLKSHKLRHSGVRPYSCPKCPQTFTQTSSLSYHLKHHNRFHSVT